MLLAALAVPPHRSNDPQDSDGDGLPDMEEIQIYGTNPNLADTDEDGAGDGEEINAPTNPLNSNSVFRVLGPRNEQTKVIGA